MREKRSASKQVEQTDQYNVAKEHITPSGVVRMKALARQKVWWPSMDKAIEHVKKSCLVCQQQSHEERKVRLHPWETPERPWQRIHVDLSGVPCGWS